jgi:hypothetical protein
MELIQQYLINRPEDTYPSGSFDNMLNDRFPRIAVNMPRGTGKTRLLVRRAAEYSMDHPGSSILMVTPRGAGGALIQQRLLDYMQDNMISSRRSIEGPRIELVNSSSFTIMRASTDPPPGYYYDALFVDDAEDIDLSETHSFLPRREGVPTFVTGTLGWNDSTHTVSTLLGSIFYANLGGCHRYTFNYNEIPGIRSVTAERYRSEIMAFGMPDRNYRVFPNNINYTIEWEGNRWDTT